MKIIKIDKEKWADGLGNVAESYRLFGPKKENTFFSFKALEKGELPDFSFSNTRLSPKSLVYPQSEAMFEYTLDETRDDHHLMKAIDKAYSPRAVIGIRPCDAKAFLLV
ncbi:MAG: 4Fe-4S ferredoxin, partial [Deltaproteobacteria bacterium]|nr:4Fe-4S ferredoxin [Deltaproteobacteria bacterium]